MVSETGRKSAGDDLDGLRIAELKVGHRTVIAVSGEIDVATVAELRAVVERVIESAAIEVWLDLGEVAFMDSSGLRLVLDARSALDGMARRFAVICPAGPVRRVLAVSGVESALAIYPDRSAAHAAG
jgi:anti-anti-sigma factor